MDEKEEYEDFRRQLERRDKAQVHIYGNDIDVRLLEDGSMLLLSAAVYRGQDYLPLGIRTALQQGRLPHLYMELLPTYFTIHEESYSVFLNFTMSLEDKQPEIEALLEEFGREAAEWRLYLDEKDRRDRVYSKAKR